jgi:catechol 2,3-dioxygenase-like lactoylglutathione lyase family enzyme
MQPRAADNLPYRLLASARRYGRISTLAPMLANAPLVALVPSTDLVRSRSFYEGTLGLTVNEVNDFACVLDAGGTMLRVTKVDELTPQPFTILGWVVPDMAVALAALVERGIEPRRYEGMGQQSDGVWVAPSGARIVWFADPDGNTLSLTQF